MQKEIKTNEQVIITPSGNLTTAIPLYQLTEIVCLEKMSDHVLALCNPKCLAYIVRYHDEKGSELLQVVSSVIIDDCEMLGDL